jgi:hypothetical protein
VVTTVAVGTEAPAVAVEVAEVNPPAFPVGSMEAVERVSVAVATEGAVTEVALRVAAAEADAETVVEVLVVEVKEAVEREAVVVAVETVAAMVVAAGAGCSGRTN